MAGPISDRVTQAFEGTLTDDAPLAAGGTGPSTAVEARASVLGGLEADLVGPSTRDADEVLPLPPSRWYLTGFLAPEQDRETRDPTAEEDFNTLEDEPEETGAQEPEPKRKHRFPASMGMSVLLPAQGGDHLLATVRFAEYLPEVPEGQRRPVWRRVAREVPQVRVPLDPKALIAGVPIAPGERIFLVGNLEAAEAPGLEAGTRALSLFLVNRRPAREKVAEQDAEFLFQVELELSYADGFLSRANRRGEGATDWDDRVADLQFRERREYAVGHGVSVEVPEGAVNDADRAVRVKTTWLPRHEVQRVRPGAAPAGSTVDMMVLADLKDGAEARERLLPIAEAYGEWLKKQAAIPVDSADREACRDTLVERAELAQARIRSGIERLAQDPEVLEAFRLANRAMATAALKRSPGRYTNGKQPEWRLFQLAFVLLNLDGVADPTHADRDNVELIFFPTGGGKTEAYLGVIAFTLLLRRIRGQRRPDKGLGVAVLLRYTLRLLTLDQLGRAATLMCALEVLRRADPKRLGEERFAVGLWVGMSATANTMGQLKTQVLEYKNSSAKNASSPFPLAECPWCQTELGKDSLQLVPSATKTEAIVVGCRNFRCDFAARRSPQGLPVLFVDEQIYSELPAFVVATVDKFAMLPWRGETGKLFGRVSGRMEALGGGYGFFGPADGKPRNAKLLPGGLDPPELIVQDELHLISGPLGTMVGLYETAIDFLSTRTVEGKAVRPKVIASTATVRRASEQIQALFARKDVTVFPPPGVDDSESFFAEVDKEAPGRLYVGIAAQARSMKGILLRTYVTALTAAQKQYEQLGAAVADPYMTVAGYFNSLRELGGMRRLVEDEVRSRCEQIEERVPVGRESEPHPFLAKRIIQAEPVELTSRESTGRIKESKDRLNKPHADKEHVDVLLASNMISVGVDIDRLGLMVVAGQPKTTAEYIQASSRVGRQHPGLVLTCFNVSKPRDRSHYERFTAYHASFYRFVEATSLTPFSTRALERGLVGALMAMTRLAHEELTAPSGAMNIEAHRAVADAAITAITERAGAHDQMTAAEVSRLQGELRDRASHLVDLWERMVKEARDEGATKRSYSKFDQDKSAGRAILSLALDPDDDRSAEERQFVAPTSMRDVEPQVHLWLERRRALGSG
ncbi:MAG: hypothetical protein CMN30_31255 [Sandaracinus sp.]|nr:hypothetical protein [Sandaracinus sp.]